ncbi:uncharacterized protein LOC132788471 [Drosophila nasuta]|uniref:Uncharacterized protein LOC117569456 n=1 Tax=Drosophila albomicans TaxID=7291 RepID=A0A6P8YH34_DROAB|nr:uncharacterized protein LOC117569456 [Drosophila albomicans]XP_060651887.1 uncharacterized protein LOC132788471 [Drosophila nasuta]
MFLARFFQRTQAFYPNYALCSNRCYSESKSSLPNVLFLGGGLGKLQGGIKEEEYFSSINQGLMCNIRKHIESSKNADYMRKWEEYQKTLDHDALYNTTCLNKYKDVHEEAFFLNENTECLKIMMNRAKIHDNTGDDA